MFFVELKVSTICGVSDGAGPDLFADFLVSGEDGDAAWAHAIAVDELGFVDGAPATVGVFGGFVPVDFLPVVAVFDELAAAFFNEVIFNEEVCDGFVGDEMLDADAAFFVSPVDGWVPGAAGSVSTFGQPHAFGFEAEYAV